jgi:hypothetical protein
MSRYVRRVAQCSFLTLLVAVVVLAGSQMGSWTQPSVQLGTYVETFDGGGPGQPGNILGATSSGGQWTLSGLVLQAPGASCNGTAGNDANGHYLFDCTTQYGGGTMTVQTEPLLWGDGFSATIAGTNSSRHYTNGNLGFSFTGSGTTSHGGTVTVQATYYGPDIPVQGTPPGHTGELTSVSLALSGVPVPALGDAAKAILALALLAAGALAALRMRS